MRPPIDMVSRRLAEDIFSGVIPVITPAYYKGVLRYVAIALLSIGAEWDRAASRRIEENQKIRELFRDALPVIEDTPLRSRLSDLVKTQELDYRISALENMNCQLRAALIDLHAHVETRTDPDARRIEDEIWKELVASTERRRHPLGRF